MAHTFDRAEIFRDAWVIVNRFKGNGEPRHHIPDCRQRLRSPIPTLTLMKG